MNKFFAALSAILVSAVLAYATTLPLVPSTPQFSEPSQIVPTLNAVVNQLNGNPGYAGTSPIVAIGALCNPAAGASPQTCNGQRGIVPFTGITIAATDTLQTFTINDSSITAASACLAQWITTFTAGSAIVVATVVPTAGVLTVISTNTAATSNAVTTGTLAFNCFN